MFQFVVLIDSVRWLVVIRKNNVWCGVVSNFFETLNDYLLLFWMCYICPSHSFRVAIKNKKNEQNRIKINLLFLAVLSDRSSENQVCIFFVECLHVGPVVIVRIDACVRKHLQR